MLTTLCCTDYTLHKYLFFIFRLSLIFRKEVTWKWFLGWQICLWETQWKIPWLILCDSIWGGSLNFGKKGLGSLRYESWWEYIYIYIMILREKKLAQYVHYFLSSTANKFNAILSFFGAKLLLPSSSLFRKLKGKRHNFENSLSIFFHFRITY